MDTQRLSGENKSVMPSAIKAIGSLRSGGFNTALVYYNVVLE